MGMNMKRIKKYNEFKLIREAKGDENEEEFNFDDFEGSEDEESNDGDENSDEMSGDGSDFDFGDDTEENTEGGDEFGGDNGEPDMEEEEVEVEDLSTYNEDPSAYITQQLKRLENRLVTLFENPQKPDEDGRVDDKDPSAYYNQGVELLDMKTTDMPMNKSLTVKYHDEEFLYHLIITVNIEEGMSEKPEDEMDTDQVEECGIKFKKYDMEDNLIGELEKKKIKISEIDQDYIDTLNGNLDSKYSVDNNFEIEYGKDGKESESDTE